MSSHCQIGRVRMKSGGADVRVMRNPFPGSTMAIRRATSQLLELNGLPDAWCVVGFWSKTGDWACNMEVYAESGLHSRYFPEAVRQLLEKRLSEREVPNTTPRSPEGA